MDKLKNKKLIMMFEMTILSLVGIVLIIGVFSISLSEKLESVTSSNYQLEKQLEILEVESIKDSSMENKEEEISSNIIKEKNITTSKDLLITTIDAIKAKTDIKDIEFAFKDKTYKTYEYSDILSVLENNSYPAYNEFYDCDDFAIAAISDSRRVLQGLTISYIKLKRKDGTYHALNGFIDSEGYFWIYEPQDKEVLLLENLDYEEILKIEY